MRQTAVVHFQWIPEGSEDLMRKIFDSDKSLGASYPPVLFWKGLMRRNGENILGTVYPEGNYYPDWAKKIFDKNRDNANITKFQEGYLHYCEGCFDEYRENGGREANAVPDPWHEIDWYCKYVPKYLEGKKELMVKGKYLLEEALGEVKGYCPPQHYSSKKSIKAAEDLGYDSFMIRNLIGLPVWKEGELTILPCAKIGERGYKESPVVFSYFDHLVGKEDIRGEFFRILKSSVPFSELPVSKKPIIRFSANQKLLHAAKRLRDKRKKIIK